MNRTLSLIVTVIVLAVAAGGCGGGSSSGTPTAVQGTPFTYRTPGADQLSSVKRDRVKVVRVLDGVTIEVEGGQKVRYIGVDAPEMNGPGNTPEPFAVEALQKNKELVDNKLVELEKDTTDKDQAGMLLRYVYVDGLFVNAEMVSTGLARAVTRPPDIKYQHIFVSLEAEARQAKRGMWGSITAPTPVQGEENPPTVAEPEQPAPTEEPVQPAEPTVPVEEPTATEVPVEPTAEPQEPQPTEAPAPTEVPAPTEAPTEEVVPPPTTAPEEPTAAPPPEAPSPAPTQDSQPTPAPGQ